MTEVPSEVTLLQQWVGKTATQQDLINCNAAVALAATLNHKKVPVEGNPLPPLWHWIYFWAIAAQADIGQDGHPERGGFLPPVLLPRRMWAGGRLQFMAPVPIGAVATRTSRILSVTTKSGKSGDLAFVTVRHEICCDGVAAITEEHDIVYRSLPGKDAPAPQPVMAPLAAAWQRTVDPDPVLLFRYSALTFNGHRIHYDRSYVTAIEGYPGLIVHGPLIATLLVDLLNEHLPHAHLSAFSFRAISPLFDTQAFTLCGEPDDDGETVRLWAKNSQGQEAMQAEAKLKNIFRS